MPRPRVPIKAGYFTVPEDSSKRPRVICSRCAKCGEHSFPRRWVCPKCMHRQLDLVEVDARGTLYSYTWVHMPMFGSTKEFPGGYGVGQIDLPEGPRLQMPLGGKQEDYSIGMELVGELDELRQQGDQDVVILRFMPKAA
jgi:uncharacterized OB-fold protein